MKPRILILSLVLLAFIGLGLNANQDRVEWTMDETYNGPLTNSFNSLRWEIPNIMRQKTIDLSVILGIPFQEGWRYPLTIRFADGSMPGVENMLAFVMLYQGEQGGIRQDLFINLEAYERENFNFEKVFAHELTHAMLNDAVGAEASRFFPVWFHEGLAVYGSGQGEQVVRSYYRQYRGFGKRALINGLEGPHEGKDYAEDFLAIKYINHQHGPNALRIFIQEVINRGGDFREAYEYVCQESWEDFMENARNYSLEELEKIPVPRRGEEENPY